MAFDAARVGRKLSVSVHGSSKGGGGTEGRTEGAREGGRDGGRGRVLSELRVDVAKEGNAKALFG